MNVNFLHSREVFNYEEYRQSLNQKLAERVERELVDFREDILSKSPQEIYDAAYQIFIL